MDGLGGPRDILAGCDAEQVEAITSEATPLCILASAGSGKTRVLTRRIAWQVRQGRALAGHVLALTFTRKAAEEMRARLGSLGLRGRMTAGTFHAVALSELRRLAAERRQAQPVVLASKSRLLHTVLERARGPARAWAEGRALANRGVGELAIEIEWAKSRLVAPDDYEKAAERTGRRCPWEPSEVAFSYKAYEVERRRRGVLDFEDLLTKCAAELASDECFAASAAWRFRHLFVDEYQDVNAAQLRLLRAWWGADSDLCVVGDPNQAIYSWNGADPEAISRFSEDFENATVLELQTNYRSTAEVVTVASSLVRARRLTPGGRRGEGTIPSVTAYPTDLDEVAGVAMLARQARRPDRSWSKMAVLARTNSQLGLFQRSFEERGIPARIVGQESAAADEEVVAESLDDVGAGEGLDPADDWMPEDAAPPQAAPGAPAPGKAAQHDAVALLTFHRAKGLEWPVVFVTGLEDGFVPIAHALDDVAWAEERRLLYVACTRAEEELHCSWATERSFAGGRPVARSPSPYLASIEAARRQLSSLARRSEEGTRQGLAESRRALAESGEHRRRISSQDQSLDLYDSSCSSHPAGAEGMAREGGSPPGSVV